VTGLKQGDKGEVASPRAGRADHTNMTWGVFDNSRVAAFEGVSTQVLVRFVLEFVAELRLQGHHPSFIAEIIA
jgi:hypothetical protein